MKTAIQEELSTLDPNARLYEIPDAEFVYGGAITNACKIAGYDESGRVTVNHLNAWGMTVAQFAADIAQGE